MSLPNNTSATVSKDIGTATILDGISPLLTLNAAGALKDGSTEIKIVPELTVHIVPNPSEQYFTINTESNSRQPLHIRVSDQLGRTIELRNNILPNSKWQIGNNYRQGFYTMEIIQGSIRKVVKLIRL